MGSRIPKGSGTRISPEQRERYKESWKRQYEVDRWSIRKIAIEAERSYGTVYLILSEAGAKMRSKSSRGK